MGAAVATGGFNLMQRHSDVRSPFRPPVVLPEFQKGTTRARGEPRSGASDVPGASVRPRGVRVSRPARPRLATRACDRVEGRAHLAGERAGDPGVRTGI